MKILIFSIIAILLGDDIQVVPVVVKNAPRTSL